MWTPSLREGLPRQNWLLWVAGRGKCLLYTGMWKQEKADRGTCALIKSVNIACRMRLLSSSVVSLCKVQIEICSFQLVRFRSKQVLPNPPFWKGSNKNIMICYLQLSHVSGNTTMPATMPCMWSCFARQLCSSMLALRQFPQK